MVTKKETMNEVGINPVKRKRRRREQQTLSKTYQIGSKLEIIEINSRSINNKLGTLKLMLYTNKPDLMAVCETWIKFHAPKFVGYSAEWKNRPSGNGGGLGLILKRGLQYQRLDVLPFVGGVLEFQIIRLFLEDRSTVDVMNLYNPNKNVTVQELTYYISQMGSKYIILGDINAHSHLLDDSIIRSNATGQTIEQIVVNGDACIANPLNFYTYYNLGTLSKSCLDICMVSPNLITGITMKKLADIGSDHIPIKIEVLIKPVRNQLLYRKKYVIKNDLLPYFNDQIENSVILKPADINSLVADFTGRLMEAASKTFKMTSGKGRNLKRACWWEAECSRSLSIQGRAKKMLDMNPIHLNAENYKIKRDEHMKLCESKKSESMNNFISELNHQTPIHTVWQRIKSFKGHEITDKPPLVMNGDIVTESKHKAELLAGFYQDQCNFNGHGDIRDIDEVIRSGLSSGDPETDRMITFAELEAALDTTKNSSPGEDNIPYILLKNLDKERKSELLQIYNQCYMIEYPEKWKQGLIIPIPKPKKDKTLVSSYRPISLLPTIGKVFEKIVQKRLNYILERNNTFSKSQCGFRKGKSTVDVLLRMEHLIRKGLSENKICLVLYMDLKGAFDTIWGKGVISKLVKNNVKGKLIRVLDSYFEKRSIKVLIDNETSSERAISSGTPQGSILSPILFNAMMSDIPKSDKIDEFVFADDITFACLGSAMSNCRILMQRHLNEFVKWTEQWGLIVNPEKSALQYFSGKRGLKYPIIRIKNIHVQYKKQQRLLGVIFDSPKLDWRPHVKELLSDCSQRINMMKAISSTTYGASFEVLRMFYVAYIRSKLDYGCLIYEGAKEYMLNKLEVVQNGAMRLMLGARRTSPILSMQVESFLAPLKIHRGHLAVKMLIKLRCRPNSLDTANYVKLNQIYDGRIPNLFNTYCYRTLLWNRTFKTPYIKQYKGACCAFPPWWSVVQYVTAELIMAIYNHQTFSSYLEEHFSGYKQVYTDSSKMTSQGQKKVGCAIYVPEDEVVECWRLRGEHSVIASELLAIYKALEKAIHLGIDRKILILTDSQAALKMICTTSSSEYDTIIYKIKKLLLDLNYLNDVHLIWVKAHVGIKGNEVVDKAAKHALLNDRTELFDLYPSEYSSILKESVIQYWFEYWQFTTNLSGKGLFLRRIKMRITKESITKSLNRRQQVAFHRLRIGHAGVAEYLHRFNMSDEEYCSNRECGGECIVESISHFLLECPAYNIPRTIMRDKLQNIGIRITDLKTLLVGESHERERDIIRFLMEYICATGRISAL